MSSPRDLSAWLAFIGGHDWRNIDMGLQRMRQMVELLDLNFADIPVITVAGTNGKGSTCVAIEQILAAAGYRVGTTLSPHVMQFNERVRVGGRECTDEELCEAFSRVEQARCDLPLSYFEFAALAALCCFRQASVDVAVLEIGLGGRLDAFNAIDANVAVITNIDLDHQGLLGSDREAIGLEKAGILRPGQKVVLGPDMPQSVIGACEALNLAPLCQGVDFSVERTPAGDSWQLVVEGRILDRVLRLGACAPSNLSLAYLACRDFDGVRLEHLALASAAVTLPGRLQALVFCGRTVIADVAHNPAGVAFLQAELEARGIEPHCVVFGMFADKDAAGVFAALRDYHALPWLLLDTIGDRGMPGRVLAGRLGLEGAPAGSLNELRGEMLSATDVGDVILAFGSFNVVEQCLAVMAHRDA